MRWVLRLLSILGAFLWCISRLLFFRWWMPVLGGKNGINMEVSGRIHKNMVGVIGHARAIYCHDIFVDTWEDCHWREGFSEVIKYAFLSSSSLLEELFRRDLEVYKKDRHLLRVLVRRCLGIKYSYVRGDEGEGGRKEDIVKFWSYFGSCDRGYFRD